jgi:hypothetical protein
MRLFNQSGFLVIKKQGIPAPFPLAIGNNLFSKALLSINKFLIWIAKNLFSYQIYIEAKAMPSIETLLYKTLQESETRLSNKLGNEINQ